MSQDNVILVRRGYEAFARGDMESVFAQMSGGIEFRLADSSAYAAGGALVGQQQIVERLFMRLAQEWDGFAVKPEKIHDAGDVVVVEGHFDGVCRATGRRTDAEFVHIWTVRDGKLAVMKEYADTAKARDVMGGGTAAAA